MTDTTTQAGSYPAAAQGTARRMAIIVSLVLVITAAASALFLVRTVDNQIQDIGTTYEVRRQASELMLALVDAETGQRGYMLTRDPSYLDPYDTAIATMGKIYDQLLQLVSSNPEQHLRLQSVAGDIEAKRAELATTIDLVSSGKVNEAADILRTDTGKQLMQRIRASVRDFIAAEDARLVERNMQMEGYRQWLVAAILAALGASAMLAYVLFTRAQQQVAVLAERQTVLLSENEALEAHVRERTAEAEEARGRAERERARLEAVLQDTNHRIGNSLATVSSLLGLQLARSKSIEVREALEAAQGRVHAIASAHRRLRLGADMETTDAAEFLEAVVDDLATTVPPGRTVTFHKQLTSMVIPARDATTLGIVISELVINALKHAFAEGQAGQIWVRFGDPGNGSTDLTVEDDGRGISGEQVSGGLGAVIIRQLARQFGGEPEYRTRAGGGTAITVHLPKLLPASD